MKKLMFLFVSLLTLTMTSCGDDDPELVGDKFNLCNKAASYVPAEGGTITLGWNEGIIMKGNAFTKSWSPKEGFEDSYKDYLNSYSGHYGGWTYAIDAEDGAKPDAHNIAETKAEGNVMYGDWFTITFIDSPVEGLIVPYKKLYGVVFKNYWGVTVTISPNTTGARRYLMLDFSSGTVNVFSEDAIIFQDCEEPEE
jgi:hypothetical protein